MDAVSIVTVVDGTVVVGAAASPKHAESRRGARTNQKTRLLTVLIINAYSLVVYGLTAWTTSYTPVKLRNGCETRVNCGQFSVAHTGSA